MKLTGRDEDDRRSGVCEKWGCEESKHNKKVVKERELATKVSHSEGGAKWERFKPGLNWLGSLGRWQRRRGYSGLSPAGQDPLSL